MNLGLSGLVVGDDTGLLFARHWGLMAARFGALLIFAAARPNFRKPIVLAALVEKLGLMVLIALAWNTPALAGLHVAALFDGACVLLLLYGAYLYQSRAKRIASQSTFPMGIGSYLNPQFTPAVPSCAQ